MVGSCGIALQKDCLQGRKRCTKIIGNAIQLVCIDESKLTVHDVVN